MTPAPGHAFPAGNETPRATLAVTEIFHSIQGESTRAGRRCVFVRLRGCNLRCSWCDTTYSFTEGREMSLDDILERVDSYRCDLVEITGGEPLLQPAAVDLARALLARGKTVLVETSGERDITVLPEGVVRVMDLKTPSSGEMGRNRWENVEALRDGDEVKFVIGSRADYEWAREKLRAHRLWERCAVLFSPVHGVLDRADLARWILNDALNVRFQTQLQKDIWGTDARGV